MDDPFTTAHQRILFYKLIKLNWYNEIDHVWQLEIENCGATFAKDVRDIRPSFLSNILHHSLGESAVYKERISYAFVGYGTVRSSGNVTITCYKFSKLQKGRLIVRVILPNVVWPNAVCLRSYTLSWPKGIRTNDCFDQMAFGLTACGQMAGHHRWQGTSSETSVCCTGHPNISISNTRAITAYTCGPLKEMYSGYVFFAYSCRCWFPSTCRM